MPETVDTAFKLNVSGHTSDVIPTQVSLKVRRFTVRKSESVIKQTYPLFNF